jgi:hypothetical protein
MTLRELMTAIDRRESLEWTVPTRGRTAIRTGIPYSVMKLPSGWYAVDVDFLNVAFVDCNRRLTLSPSPSPTSDPLDAELR